MKLWRKAWLIMRFTTLLLFVAALHVSAKTTAQKITLSSDNITIDQFFNQLKKQTGYSFLINHDIVSIDKKISVHVTNGDLEDVLKQVLTPLSLSYKIENNFVYILKLEANAGQIISPEVLPPIDIHGRVTDSLGHPLIGASIIVKGSKKGTTTDVNGNFVLTGVNDNATLIISYTGYFTKQYKVGINNDVSVFLNKSNSPLDEVQVIAYGSQTNRFSVGAVSTVKAEDIEKQPVSNPLLALEGRVPGLFITQSNGNPGSAVAVQIRGQNSIANGNDPYYVIDGVPYTSQLAPNAAFILGTSNGGGSYGNPLNYINPSDIESIDVLKDADATAIYGSRAANGAILITTKKGKSGKTKVDVNMQTGWGKVTRKISEMNTPEYLQMRHEAIANDGLTTQPTDYDINGIWDTTRYTNWQNELIGGTAQYTNIYASVSGGNANTQFLVGGTYNRQTSVFPGSFSDQKSSLHFNINNVSLNQKFHFQLSGNYLIDNNLLPSTDLTSTALYLAPDAPPLYNSDGNLNWAPDSSGTSTWTNPLSQLNGKYINKANNLLSNALISYIILPGFEIKSSFGYTNLQSNEITTNPSTVYKPEQRASNPSYAYYGNSNINSWIVEPQLTFNKSLGKGKINVLVGTTIEQNNNNGEQLVGVGYSSDLVLENIQSADNLSVQSTSNAIYKYNALFGRLNYVLNEKYIVDITARRDGSSRFGSANQFHNFGSIGLGWIFTQENLFKDNLQFISFGKLTGSYGTTGNDQIGDYKYLSLYQPFPVQIPYQGQTAIVPSGLANPYLEWEETKKLQFEISLGFLKERILFNSTYYNNRSNNQLLPYSLPIITGFSSINENFPATVQNSGWEFTLNTSNIKSKDFDWSTIINVTIPSNKLLAFPNISNSSYASTFIVGQPITIIKTFHSLGVDPSSGIYQFEDTQGSPTTNPQFGVNNNSLVNTAPKFYGGFQNTIRYKSIQLDFLFQFVKQIQPNYYFGLYPGTFNINQPLTLLDRWQKPGDIKPIQQYNSDFSLYQSFANAAYYGDASYSDASYIRLKNLSLSWQLPEPLLKRAHIESCRLYVLCQNLITITHYDGLDPETHSTNFIPPLKIVNIGIQMTF